MMKAIIFDTREQAEEAIKKCDDIAPMPSYLPYKPYTFYREHPSGDGRCAVIADKAVETAVGQEALELTADWNEEPLNNIQENG